MAISPWDTNPLTKKPIESTSFTPAFSTDGKASTLGFDFDIDEAIRLNPKLLKAYNKAYNKYFKMGRK